MTKILFINTRKAQCSIWSSGDMILQALRSTSSYQVDAIEIDKQDSCIPLDYDIFLFNYHPITMSWLNPKSIQQLPGLKFTVVLEVLPNDPFPLCPRDLFDGYVVLDPTMQHADARVFAFPRPLENLTPTVRNSENAVPVIGSFGFATSGKGFEHVVDAVNKEFDRAVVRINIPYGTYVQQSEQLAKHLAEQCKAHAKPGIEVQVTHAFMSKQELVDWCAANTLNCFLYDRNQPGLSATTDQAILADRPLCVSNNETFRHILAYLQPYPTWSLREALQNSLEGVRNMQKDWHPSQFAACFEKMLTHYTLAPRTPGRPATYRLKPYSRAALFSRAVILRLRSYVQPWIDRGMMSARLLVLNLLKMKQGAARQCVSYSQAGEDLIIRALFQSFGMQQIRYLDIGANHPDFISNTYLFYTTGSRGVTVEPNPKLYAKHRALRPDDTCINAGIGFDDQPAADFYVFGGMADGLSTFSKEEAERFENVGVEGVGRFKIARVMKMPLKKINAILAETGVPDFLSIDIEGLDLAVLKTLDFATYRITCICVETIHYDADSKPQRNREIVQLLTDNGYMIYAETSINTIFVDQNWFMGLTRQQ